MNFYTSVNRYGNNILLRGFEGGQRFSKKIVFTPTLFDNIKAHTGWHNLQGESVVPRTFDTMREATQYLRDNEEVSNKTVYGSNNFITQFINDRYPGEIKFQRDKVNVTTIDIEVASDDGFPHVEQAAHPVTTITMKNNIDNIYRVWGLYDYEPNACMIDGVEAIEYVKCKDEIELLLKFLQVWSDPKLSLIHI